MDDCWIEELPDEMLCGMDWKSQLTSGTIKPASQYSIRFRFTHPLKVTALCRKQSWSTATSTATCICCINRANFQDTTTLSTCVNTQHKKSTRALQRVFWFWLAGLLASCRSLVCCVLNLFNYAQTNFTPCCLFLGVFAPQVLDLFSTESCLVLQHWNNLIIQLIPCFKCLQNPLLLDWCHCTSRI